MSRYRAIGPRCEEQTMRTKEIGMKYVFVLISSIPNGHPITDPPHGQRGFSEGQMVCKKAPDFLLKAAGVT